MHSFFIHLFSQSNVTHSRFCLSLKNALVSISQARIIVFSNVGKNWWALRKERQTQNFAIVGKSREFFVVLVWTCFFRRLVSILFQIFKFLEFFFTKILFVSMLSRLGLLMVNFCSFWEHHYSHFMWQHYKSMLSSFMQKTFCWCLGQLYICKQLMKKYDLTILYSDRSHE